MISFALIDIAEYFIKKYNSGHLWIEFKDKSYLYKCDLSVLSDIFFVT